MRKLVVAFAIVGGLVYVLSIIAVGLSPLWCGSFEAPPVESTPVVVELRSPSPPTPPGRHTPMSANDVRLFTELATWFDDAYPQRPAQLEGCRRQQNLECVARSEYVLQAEVELFAHGTASALASTLAALDHCAEDAMMCRGAGVAITLFSDEHSDAELIDHLAVRADLSRALYRATDGRPWMYQRPLRWGWAELYREDPADTGPAEVLLERTLLSDAPTPY